MDAAEHALEERKLGLEERRVAVEERRANQGFWTRLTVGAPIVAAIIAFGASAWVQREDEKNALALQEKQADADFELKVAEIVMNAEGPYGTRHRAVALRQIFPSQLGEDFATSFNPEDASDRQTFERDQRVASKRELLKLLAEHPQEREQIIKTWRYLFPADGWIAGLQ